MHSQRVFCSFGIGKKVLIVGCFLEPISDSIQEQLDVTDWPNLGKELFQELLAIADWHGLRRELFRLFPSDMPQKLTVLVVFLLFLVSVFGCV